ncbi:MAG: helix-turn-helix transcriptional regulator [Methylotenera sp.]|nr:helix-turn-helix transcriptional regulator [Methylotenera sp.]MDP1958903.1 helix-turn-helix transcriptional regulator [Methylotenera sp.]MDP3942902.1 helix-turn-helix transcriptional regulator [Methylotenera sp.]
MKNPLDVAVACGIVLRRLRKDAGLTQEQLALEADLQRSYVSILELGQQQPSLTTILKLADALGRSAQSLMADIESELEK